MLRRLAIASGLAALLTMGAAALPACVLELDEGLAVELRARFEVVSGRSADGASLTLDEARLHVEDATLLPCDPTEARVGFAVSRAHAHHASGDPLSASGPRVIELGPEGATLGAMRPPPGRYCVLRVTVTPASELGENALVARGRWERGGASGAIEVSSPGQRELALPLSPPLVIDATEPAAAVELEVDLPAALAAHAVVDRDPVDLGLDLMVDLGAALRARVLP